MNFDNPDILPKSGACEDGSAPKALEELLQRAERAGVSDVHLHRDGKAARVSFRLDGVMSLIGEIQDPLAERLFGRIKYLARLKTYQDSLPQDGRIDHHDLAVRNDIRVATYPTVTGEKIVLRLFQQVTPPTLNELGLAQAPFAELERFLKRTSGLLLLTGPAGSGKTTTIYACLRWLAESGGRHIITIEDPVEQIVAGVMQTEVNEARGLDFACAARHLLRQDPQVLVIGEIRDDETAQLAVRASLTGHLVISTLHAGSCRGVVERLTLMVPDHYAAASALELIVNQRLVRKICLSCGAKGCADCFQTGFRGRIPLVEWVRLDDEARRQIRSQGPDNIIPSISLADSGHHAVQAGITTEEEFQRVFGL